MIATLAGQGAVPWCAASVRAAANPDDAFDAVIWMGVLIGVVIVGGVVVAYLRSRMRTPTGLKQATFTFDDLRRMRDRGEVTIAEYETLRKKLLDELRYAGPGREERARADNLVQRDVGS
jgi:hypothetical protein